MSERISIINGVEVRDITPKRTQEEVNEFAKALLAYGREKKKKKDKTA